MSWIYDSDFEVLKDDNIKKVIIGGFGAYDYKVRILMAGVDEKKIFVSPLEVDTYKYLDFKNIDKIIIIHDIYLNKKTNEIISKIKDVLE